MTKLTTSKILTLLTVITSIGLLGTISFSGIVNAGGEGEPSFIIPQQIPVSQAIPDWVDNNFRWYGEGLIEQSDLLNSLTYLLDEGHMFLSDKAAKEVSDLRTENQKLHDEVIQYRETDFDFATRSMEDKPKYMGENKLDDKIEIASMYDEAKEEALHHLQKAYDLNTNFETKIMQYDKDHKDWILIESWSWGESTAGDPDRPIITGQVYNSETTDDRPTEEVAFYYNKIDLATETIKVLMNKGNTIPLDWGVVMPHFTSGDSTADDLNGIMVLCNIAMDKEIHALQAEISVLQGLSDMKADDATQATDTTRATGDSTEEEDQVWWGERLFNVDQKIKSLQTGLDVCEAELKNWEEQLSSVGDDAQLANIDLQNALQKQQQTLQTLSNVSKMLHDTSMSIIRKIG